MKPLYYKEESPMNIYRVGPKKDRKNMSEPGPFSSSPKKDQGKLTKPGLYGKEVSGIIKHYLKTGILMDSKTKENDRTTTNRDLVALRKSIKIDQDKVNKQTVEIEKLIKELKVLQAKQKKENINSNKAEINKLKKEINEKKDRLIQIKLDRAQTRENIENKLINYDRAQTKSNIEEEVIYR